MRVSEPMNVTSKSSKAESCESSEQSQQWEPKNGASERVDRLKSDCQHEETCLMFFSL